MSRRTRATAWVVLAGHLLGAGPLARASGEADAGEPPPLRLRVPEEETPPVLGYVLAGSGLLGGIALATLLKEEADDAYDRYLLTADPDAARSHLDDAERYDRLSIIGWVVAQASFVTIFYLLTREREKPLIPVEGEPVVRPTDDGVQVGWRIGP